MKKSLIALCAAAALTVPMIAQADAHLLMAHPALFMQLDVDQAEAPIMVAEKPEAIYNRLPMPQLEAAALLANKSNSWPNGSGFAKITYEGRPINEGAKPEVGWRQLA